MEYGEGPLLVLAGAGSGKTRALTFRLAYLLEQGMAAPWEVLAITFTNKAADEMRRRVEGLVGPDLARDIWISTFHSACNRILRRDIDKLGYGRNYVIYDTTDQRSLVRECVKELGWDEKRYHPNAVLGTIGKAKDNLIGPADFEGQADDFWAERVAQVYHLYQNRLRDNNALDFDDMIRLCVKLFEEFPAVLRYYQHRFRFVLVDEFQDTNKAQYQWVRHLASEHRNLAVVGDDDQSIYGWRNADIRNILDFEKDFPEAHVVKLEQNYRSTRKNLHAANSVIKNNTGRKPKELWTDNDLGDEIRLFHAFNEQQEAAFVSGEIRRLERDEGLAPSDCAVLYRTNAQSRVFEEVFMREGLSYQIVGSLKFYDRKEIKDLIAYLRVIHNPADEFSLSRIVNEPKRGVGPATWDRIREFAAAEGTTVYEGLRRIEEIGRVNRPTCQALLDFVEVMDEYIEMKETRPVTDILQGIAKNSGYVGELEAEGTIEAKGRLENIRELYNVAAGFVFHAEDPSLEGFLTNIALISDVDTLEDDASGVLLMTLHTAKGLEFPVVFMVGLEEEVFPHSRSLASDSLEELEEERRLCYVGITRAERFLYMTAARLRMVYGHQTEKPLSRFVQEIPSELRVHVDASGRPEGQGRAMAGLRQNRQPSLGFRQAKGSGANQAKWSRANQAKGSRANQAKGSGANAARSLPAEGATSGKAGHQVQWRQGDKLLHPKWGRGTVVSIREEEGDQVLMVAFVGEGVKQLMASYAPVEKIDG